MRLPSLVFETSASAYSATSAWLAPDGHLPIIFYDVRRVKEDNRVAGARCRRHGGLALRTGSAKMLQSD